MDESIEAEEAGDFLEYVVVKWGLLKHQALMQRALTNSTWVGYFMSAKLDLAAGEAAFFAWKWMNRKGQLAIWKLEDIV